MADELVLERELFALLIASSDSGHDEKCPSKPMKVVWGEERRILPRCSIEGHIHDATSRVRQTEKLVQGTSSGTLVRLFTGCQSKRSNRIGRIFKDVGEGTGGLCGVWHSPKSWLDPGLMRS